jgi:hypothetical protein
MEFAKQLTLTIRHEYFNQAYAPGLVLRPSEGCSRLLKKFNMLAKANAGGLTIFKASTPAVPNVVNTPSADIAFDFLIFTADSEFYQYTALGDKKNDEVYLFSNQKTNKNITELAKSIVSAVDPGEHTDKPLLGIIRLRLNYKDAVELTLSFDARSVKWRYYVLASPTRSSLVVDGKLCGVAFSRKESVTTSADAVVEALTTNYPVAKISFFESDKAVAFNNEGRKNIQLKNELSNAVIIKHLPNPPLHNNGIQIINLLD